MRPSVLFGSLLLLAVAAPSLGADIMMTFEGQPVIPPGVYAPPYELKAGDTHTYYFNASFSDASAEAQFDYDIVLEILSGDSDLMVSGPVTDSTGSEMAFPTLKKFSLHHTGDEVVFITREEIMEAGEGLYSAVVHGYGSDNAYRMVLEKAYSTRSPPPEEQAALEVIYQKCCTDDNESCPVLARAVESNGTTEVENFCHLPEQSCNSEGHIIALRLPSQELECSFPEELGVLSHLQRLDLQDNSLKGSVEDLFATFADSPIESIQLQKNEIGGTLPCLPTEGNLSQALSYLDLSYNDLKGELPACFIGPELTILTLEANYLYGELPPELPASENMQHFDISWQEEDADNRMTGPLPDFTMWPNLEFLGLADNLFIGPFPAVPPTIRSLHLADNSLDGPIPSLGDMQELVALFASNNKFYGNLPSELPASLMILDLNENDISGQVPAASWLDTAPLLTEIRIGGNQIDGDFPYQFGQFTFMWALNTTGNSFVGTFDDFVAALPASNTIIQFEAGHNQMTGSVPPAMSKLAMLKDSFDPPSPRDRYQRHRFNLAFNELTGDFPTSLVLDASDDIYLDFDIRGNLFQCPVTWIGLEFESAFDYDVLLHTDCVDAEGATTTLALTQQALAPSNSTTNFEAVVTAPEDGPDDRDRERPEAAEDGAGVASPDAETSGDRGTNPDRNPTVPGNGAPGGESGSVSGAAGLGLDKVYSNPSTAGQDLLLGAQKPEEEAQEGPADSESGGLQLQTIIIIAAAAAGALLCVVVAIIVFCCCRKRSGKAYQNYGNDEQMSTPRKGPGQIIDSGSVPDVEHAGSSADHSMELSMSDRMSGANKADLAAGKDISY